MIGHHVKMLHYSEKAQTRVVKLIDTQDFDSIKDMREFARSTGCGSLLKPNESWLTKDQLDQMILIEL